MDMTMRIRNLLLFIFLFHTSSHATSTISSLCANLPNGVLLPNPLSSFSYIMCIQNDGVELKCPSGYCFDRSMLICNTKCKGRDFVNSCNCDQQAQNSACDHNNNNNNEPQCTTSTPACDHNKTPPCTPSTPACDHNNKPITNPCICKNTPPPCTPSTPACDHNNKPITNPCTCKNTPPPCTTAPPCTQAPCTCPTSTTTTTCATTTISTTTTTSPTTVTSPAVTTSPAGRFAWRGLLRSLRDAKVTPDGYMMNPKSCRKYYIVQGGKANPRKCPKGQWFDRTLLKCLDSSLVTNCLPMRD